MSDADVPPSDEEDEAVITVFDTEAEAPHESDWTGGPEASRNEIVTTPVSEWIESIDIETTADVPVPERLVDQVIGQEAASIVIRKAAEQRRHMLMIGDPGTGKSMLARSMTELLPKDVLEDVLCYPNEDDENEPRVRTVPAGRGDRIVKAQREQLRIQRERSQRMLLIGFVSVAALLAIIALSQGDLMTLLFGMLLLGFAFVFIRSRLGSADESRIPKVLVKHEPNEMPPFVDATETLAGSLLGDVRHDPFQSGGMETPAHDRVEPGAIHRAHGGVLYIDEINLLRLHEQQALLTAMQERAFPISGRSERSSGALTKTEAVPCDFVLIAAGNLDAIQGMHPALRSRIRGYGYEVYVNSEMPDTARNRRRLVRFIAQEVRRDSGTVREIPHFHRSAVARSSEKHSGGRADVASSRCVSENWVAWCASQVTWPRRTARPTRHGSTSLSLAPSPSRWSSRLPIE